MSVIAGAAVVPHVLNVLPTAAAVAVLCALVIAEIAALPGVLLPGGTMALLAGALIGSGRPALAVAVPVAAAVIAGDHLAYLSGAAVIGWWRRHRPGRSRDQHSQAARHGRAARWLAAAMPSLAGAAQMSYRSFAVRLLAMRVPWLAGLLTAGALAAHSLAATGRIAGIAGLAASAAAAAALLAARGRLPVRVIIRAPKARLAGLLLAAGLASWVCGAILQDTVAHEETVHLNPRVAGLLASHVPPGAAHGAVSLSHLVQPPGLWIMAVMAVAFLDVRRRGRSTLRAAAATAASLATAAVLDATLPGWDRHPPVSLGAAAIAALTVATAVFAGRWLDLFRAGITAAALGLAAAGLALALAVAGQPFTALAAGASLGTAIAATIEAATRLRCGRWLADTPHGTPATT
jgi:membrane protein DedA with SNARE-associated domain